ncbi:MAG: cobalamin-dependent protein [Myxococcales bacterium]|nr:cobalamin-dependent protein [Myxococcales bacterium]
MRLCLVGADFEENLGIGMIAAAAEDAGHAVSVEPFNHRSAMQALCKTLCTRAPDVIGLSIQFQHRVPEFLRLARTLRRDGYRGHITCGGQFPSLAWKETLDPRNGIDSVVLHEGERTVVALLAALEVATPLADVPGLAIVGDDGAPLRTASQPLASLDELPLPKRYRPHSRHMGVPFIPLMASRGCWEACAYCSIVAFYKDARDYGGGKLIRQRSAQNVADEMALLWHRAGGSGVFCFHDDNFLLPKPERSLERVKAIHAALEEHGVGTLGIVGKSRPDCIDRPLARALRELGTVRLYIGVENASEIGAGHLGRGAKASRADEALSACREAGIFVCYNLLVFEPDSRLDHIGDNIAFIRRHPWFPVNFCRAEPYYGTPLHHDLAGRGGLSGSYLGFDYRIEDNRAELLFRVCAAAFRQRNFAPDGVANRYMGLGYAAKLVQQFYDDPHGRIGYLLERADDVTSGISLETASFLEEALELVESGLDHEELTRRTVDLGLRIAAADARWHAELDETYAMISELGEPPPRRPAEIPSRLRRLARSIVLGTSLTFGASLLTAGCDTNKPVPTDGGLDSTRDGFVVDPLPPDMGRDATRDGFVVDPLPPDMGLDAARDSTRDGFVVDPLPPDMSSPQASLDNPPATDRESCDDLFHWTDSSPKRSTRSQDLPLYDPPSVELQSRCEDDQVFVTVRGLDQPATTRWQATGAIHGEGLDVCWLPASETDLLRVAVRTRGGVAVLELRARDAGQLDTRSLL